MPPSSARTECPPGQALAFYRVSGGAGPARLKLVGELDLATADRAGKAVRRAQDETPSMICDLGEVWFIDLSGLQILLSAAIHAERTGGRFTVTNCPPIVPHMLRLLKLDKALEIHPAPRAARSHACAELRPHVS